MNNQTLRAVIYCRVSTEEQAENGTSLETQEIACLRKAAEIGAQVVGSPIRDEGVSGGLFLKRPGIQAALTQIESGAANVLIVYSISRLSRDAEHQQTINKTIARVGARLIVCDMPLEDTEEGELMFGMFGNFAQYERKLIRKRSMMGFRRLAEKGIQPCRSQQPYGYDIVTKKDVYRGKYAAEQVGTYVIVEDEAGIVREMYARYAAGHSLSGLCKWLNDAGVPTARNGQCWRPRAVMSMLQNPTYKGQATYGRTQVIEDERRSYENGFKQTRYQRPRTDGRTVVIPAPVIVDESTWFVCQERLNRNKDLMSGNPKRKRLLSGLARCSICGRGLVSRTTTKGDRSHGYYLCNRIGADIHKPSPAYPVTELESLVTDTLIRAESAPERIEAAFVAYALRSTEQPYHGEDVTEIRRELSELDTQEKFAARAQVDALAKGRNPEVYDQMLGEIDTKRKGLQKRLQAAETSRATSQPITDPKAATLTVEKALAALRKVLTAEDVLTVAERREVLASFVDEIVPTAEGVRLTLRPAQTVQMAVVT